MSASLPADVLLLGDPRLRRRARSIHACSLDELARARAQLLATLADFRRRMGFGRAIAAPQIGHDIRLIALDLGAGPFTIADPEIVSRSSATVTLWDDCMSFPGLMVKVRRHASISLRYLDEEGREQTWRDLDASRSELLQHEIDHLDGVLAVDRAEPSATPGESLVLREVYQRMREHFDCMVDIAIVPTIPTIH
jgi:peptide deformylase